MWFVLATPSEEVADKKGQQSKLPQIIHNTLTIPCIDLNTCGEELKIDLLVSKRKLEGGLPPLVYHPKKN